VCVTLVACGGGGNDSKWKSARHPSFETTVQYCNQPTRTRSQCNHPDAVPTMVPVQRERVAGCEASHTHVECPVVVLRVVQPACSMTVCGGKSLRVLKT